MEHHGVCKSDRCIQSCVIVPHIGSATFATRTDMAKRAVANVLAVLLNEPMVSEKTVLQD